MLFKTARTLFRGSLFSLLLAAACTSEKAAETESAETVAEAPAPAPIPEQDAETEVAPAPAAPAGGRAHDIACFLAGIKQEKQSSLAEIQGSKWKQYSASSDSSWSRYNRNRTQSVLNWTTRELAPVHEANKVLFYPFSGPDFLNATTFFPSATTYVLVGLEPVGTLPDTSVLNNPAVMGAIRKSLHSVMNFSFFRTNSMAEDLKSKELNGTTPLLLLFLARTGHTVLDYKRVQLDRQGSLQPGQDSSARSIPGAKITFADWKGTNKTLYYFSADLSNSGSGVANGLGAFVKSLGPQTTYLKSASYLMHKSYFSQIRNLILSESDYILQDDSGIALKYLDKDKWDFTYYGTYDKPINLFARHTQPALKAAYQDSVNRPRPLPFGTGYDWQKNTSNLLLLKKKSS